jgi:predicted amidohydrolase YtcJ
MRNGIVTSVAWMALLSSGCGAADEGDAPADIVLVDGLVRTMDAERPTAEAVAVRGRRIVFVGTSEGARRLVGPETKVLELDGKTVLPGLIDAHTHLLASAAELEDVDLSGAVEIDELIARISAGASEAPDEPWVVGAGWDLVAFDGLLDKELLDGVVPDRPAYMQAVDGHSAWINTRALAAAGIDASTNDPPGGVIERDTSGEPTGILRESAIDLVAAVMPGYSQAQTDRGFVKAQAMASAFGITTIVDANADAWVLRGYERFEKQGRLDVRVRAAIYVDAAWGIGWQRDEVERLKERFRSDLIGVNAVKIFMDGVIESQTAQMIDPYLDGSNAEALYSTDRLTDFAAAFDGAGLQLHVHSIGDGATRQMLDVIERVAERNGPQDRRPVLAHLEVIDPDDVARFAPLGVMANFQPLWAYPDSYIEDLTIPVIGPARSEWLYPIAAVADAGGVISAGSDWSVSSMNPFEAMEVAVTRRDPSGAGEKVLTPQHRIDVQQILEAYTVHGARVTFTEDELGTITVGKLADIIVVDRDPVTVEPEDLSEIRVMTTVLEGREVLRAGDGPARSPASRRARVRSCSCGQRAARR